MAARKVSGLHSRQRHGAGSRVSADPYIYPGTNILRNKLDIHDAGELEQMEGAVVTQRAREGLPAGHFNFDHLHRHLFQDVYEWAGEVRKIEIAKGQQKLQFRRYIETGMADVHN